MIIRPFDPDDLAGLLLVQQAAGAGNSWQEEDYLRLVQGTDGLILVACELDAVPARVTGFVALQRVFDHAEVLNLAVHPGHQRRGIGRKLLAEACRRVYEAGARTLSLEARPSNTAAIQLYRSAGFALQSVRKDYYCDPAEDGHVFTVKLPLAG